MIGVKQGGLALTLPVIIAALAIGGGVILTTGLLCGLVARPNNCIDRPTTASTARPATTPMATVSTTTPGTGTTPAAATTTPIAATSSTPAGATTSTPSIVVTTSAAGATTTPLPATSTSTPLPATSTSTPLPATSPIVTTDRVTSTPLVTGSVTARETTPGFTLPPLTTASTINPRTTPATLVEFRLPTALAPNKYDLLLRVDHDPYSSQAEADSPKSLGYTGEVSIEFRAVEATSQIVLHMDQAITLTDQNVAVTSNGVPIGVANKAYDNFQIYRINLTAPLALNSVNTLALKFRSRTTKDGFYFHGYQESSQRERSSLGTRFVPNYARTAFPCFDEPGFKAQFSLVIEHPRTSIALSNYPVLTQVDFNDADRAKTRTTFQTTQPISTYSLGWAVVPADFGKKTIANVPGLGIDISIYGRASELDLGFGDFALEVAQKTLVYLRNKLGTPNALPPKVDLIALPYFPDFSSPSWGLNGFKEYDLFYTDGENSKFDRQLTALTVAKEMAHNWFGDYLTCEFWDDVWIQEGLAQYYQYLAVNDAYPEWDIIDQFLIENTVPVMWRDGYESAVPLKFLIYETVQFKYLFTDLLYKKSAALMRMFSTAYGVADFETSVNNFLASTAYGTYNFENFANLFPMSTNLGMPAKDYLEPWVVQRNLPQITLIKDDSGASTRVTFIQERFLLVILDLETDITTEYRWPIHIECKAGGSIDDPLAGSVTEFKYLLTGASGSVTLPGKFNWVKCNKDFTGYYITDYGDSQFAAFETVLLNARDTFSVADRVNLVHTAFELAWLGTHSYGPPSLITIYMTFNEQNLCPWRTLFYHIDRLALLTEHRESFRNLRAFVMQEIVDAIDNLGLNLYEDSANHIEELLKIEFANQLGRLQNVQALNTFTTLFKNISGSYFVDPNNNQLPLSSNLRSLTYKYHMQNTYDINDWFELYSFFFITNEAREKEYALEAIANTRQTFLYDLILDDLLFDPNDRVPIEAAPILFASMGANPTARYFAWYYIREYWGDLFLKGADMRKLSDSMLIITSSFDSLLLVDEAASFFLTSYDFEATDTRLRMLETGLNNYIWVLDREADFELYFFELTK